MQTSQPQNTLKIGLTGGIASGKSSVAAAFAELGVPVILADQIARDVVEPGTPALLAIANHFGDGVLLSDGALDRAALREIVFADPAQRQALESITHPAINQEIERQAHSSDAPYLVLELPLLVEKQNYRWLNRILVVDVPREFQLARLKTRNGIEGQQAENMLAAQASREDRLAIANDTFDNSGEHSAIAAAVAQLHSSYNNWASTEQTPQALQLP